MITQPTSVRSFTPARLQAVVLDWAGTTVDFGSRAPIMALLAAFEQTGVPITEAEARAPMGRAKRDHLDELLTNPAIAARWREARGADPNERDLDAIYGEFLVLQAECVVAASPVIEGCPAAIDACRSRGLKIGSSTGYPRSLLDGVIARAATEGYSPDVALSADDVAPGRPAPWLILENARRLGVFPASAIANVDDTPAGIESGRNAGAWCVGVVRSGNEVGLSESALAALPSAERDAKLAVAAERLVAAGAHLLIDTIADLPDAIDRINGQLVAGRGPDEAV
ncbi:MAG: phosphonoacetaldehyde hydrolase [Lacipirellulaceae bacterium]